MATDEDDRPSIDSLQRMRQQRGGGGPRTGLGGLLCGSHRARCSSCKSEQLLLPDRQSPGICAPTLLGCAKI